MTKEYEMTLADYLSIMRSHAPYLIGIFFLVLLLAVIVAFAIPPTYRASGTIMVATQGPDVMAPVAGRNDIDERINVIRQRVMTREGLLPIINKYSLFGDSALALTTTELIDKMRSRIAVESISSKSSSNQYNQPTIAFTISFDDRRPEVALQVTNDLVTLFLQWNVKLRTEGATEAATFLGQESDRLKAEVDRLEEKISAYKKQNSGNLPEQMTLRATMIARAENDLYSVERDIRTSNEELRSLEAELSAARRGMAGDPSQSLPALKAEYAKLSVMYTESHPDIVALKHKIDVLQHGGSTDEPKNPLALTSADALKIQTKMDAVNARLESLTQQKKMLQGRIAQNEHAMEQTPGVAQTLDVLIRDRDSAQRKFDEIRNKKVNAQITQNLESENKSERFTLLEPPILPEKPFKPDRMKIIALGIFLAFACSGGLLMALPAFDRRVRGVDALAHVMGYRPMATIPYLVIPEEEAIRKRMLTLAMIAAISTMSLASLMLFLSSKLPGNLFVKMLAAIS